MTNTATAGIAGIAFPSDRPNGSLVLAMTKPDISLFTSFASVLVAIAILGLVCAIWQFQQRITDLEMKVYRLESYASEKTNMIHEPITPAGYDEWHRAQRKAGR